MNFQGKGFQLEYGAAASRLTPEEKPLLFACGCAMLMDRARAPGRRRLGRGDVRLLRGRRARLAAQCARPRGVVRAPRRRLPQASRHLGTLAGAAAPAAVRAQLASMVCTACSTTRRCERTLPAALLLAADRALLESGLSRAADVTPRSVYRRLAGALPAALRARGISRSTPIRQALGRVWQRGLVTLGSDVLRLSAAAPRSRRQSYLLERGAPTPSADAQSQPIPIAAAAMLSGIYGFLSEIPQLVERRHAVQRQRRVEDGDILQRFGTHWLAPSGSRLQAEHHAMHNAIADEFGIAAISAPRPTGPGGRAASAVLP